MRKIWLSALAVSALALAACGGADEDAETSGESTAPTGGTGAPGFTTNAATPKLGMEPSYGKDGVLTTPLSATEHDRFMAVTVAPDGKVYAAGFVSIAGDQAMALAKFNTDGTQDKSFGKDGVAIVNVAVGGKTVEIARSVVVQSSGKIIIAGPIERDPSATGDAAKDTDIAVVRFDSTGKLDAAFGREGIARVDFATGKATSATAYVGDNAWAVGSLAGDRVVLWGTRISQAGADRTDTDYVLAGLTSAGVLDTAFGTNGFVSFDFNGSADNTRHLSIAADGKILASGYSNIGGVIQPTIARVSAAGVPDTTFGQGGIATAKVLDGVAEAYAVGFQGSDYITAGYGRGADTTEKVDLIINRFLANGTHDKAFGTDGVTRLDLAREDDRARNVTVLEDGRILAVGSGKLDATNINGMIFLTSKDGKAITEFGKDGYILSDLGGPNDAWFGVALSPDGKTAYVAGYKGVAADSGQNDDAVITKISL